MLEMVVHNLHLAEALLKSQGSGKSISVLNLNEMANIPDLLKSTINVLALFNENGPSMQGFFFSLQFSNEKIFSHCTLKTTKSKFDTSTYTNSLNI